MAEYLRQKSCRIIKARWRTPYAEIDLLVESRQGSLWIFEVKNLSHFDFLEVRVSWQQKKRLRRAYQYVQSKTNRKLHLALACVDPQGRVLIFEDL